MRPVEWCGKTRRQSRARQCWSGHSVAERCAAGHADDGPRLNRLEVAGLLGPQRPAAAIRFTGWRSSGSTRRLWKNLSTSRDRVSAVVVRSLEAVSTDVAAL